MKISRSDLANIISGKILQNEPMSRRTTFRIGGRCDFYVEVKTATELGKLIRLCHKKKTPYQVIGFGSNVLVKDDGLRGIIIRLKGDLGNISFDLKKHVVFAGGGCALQLFVKKCVDNGLSGAEPLVGIPGTVGGAVIMNAGTKGGDIGTLIKSVTVIDEKGNIKKIEKKSLKFSYRDSNIGTKNTIVSVALSMKKGDKNKIVKKLNELMRYRAKTQPIGLYNAGCIFKNPPGGSAGRLIEEARLKGLILGGAVVSKLHANYINNLGAAKAGDILKLIKLIQNKVKEKFNKRLELEIKVIGK